MGELNVRRRGGSIVPRYQGTDETQRKSGDSSTVQRTSGHSAASGLDSMKLPARMTQEAGQAQAARKALQSGEAALREVQDSLATLEDLLGEASGEDADREALKGQLRQVLEEIDKVIKGGVSAGLFSGDSEAREVKIDTLVDSLMKALSPEQLKALPDWLHYGLTADAPSREALLSALGLNSSSSSAELMAALSKLPLDGSQAAAYLATLYLGAAISGNSSGTLDPNLAAEGLRQLMEAIANGSSPDEAIAELTGGKFTSLLDFQAQFTGGTAPGMEEFLSGFLLSGQSLPDLMDLLAVMGSGGNDTDMLLELLAMLDGSGSDFPELGGSAQLPENDVPVPETHEMVVPAKETSASQPAQAASHGMAEAQSKPSASQPQAQQATAASQSVPAEQVSQPMRLTTGTTVLQDVKVPQLAAEGTTAHVRVQGQTAVAQLQLGDGAVLTVESRGNLHIGTLRGGEGSVLRLTGGAVTIGGDAAQQSQAQIVVDGAVALMAAKGTQVVNAQGQPLEAFDVVWKALFPGWQSLAAIAVDGKHAQLGMLKDGPELMRLWMLKGDPSHGYPAHSVAFQGRDQAGELHTQYIYLRWSQQLGRFREVHMYPNPFTVTGGEEGRDWHYEESSRTLRILTGKVTGISGGMGEDANLAQFSGRITMANGLGGMELTLDGVECRVSSGRAMSIGGGNSITLLLASGSANIFESGTGCAGISLGEGSTLHIDQAGGHSLPIGTLMAVGGMGSVGIGRDGGLTAASGSIIVHCKGVTITNKEGAKLPSGEAEGKKLAPKFPVSVRTLGLDAMDISTQDAAKNAMDIVRADRRWIGRLQEACRAMYSRLEQGLGRRRSRRGQTGQQSGRFDVQPGQIAPTPPLMRETDAANELLWDMCQELMQSPLAAYGQWGEEELGDIMRVISGK